MLMLMMVMWIWFVILSVACSLKPRQIDSLKWRGGPLQLKVPAYSPAAAICSRLPTSHKQSAPFSKRELGLEAHHHLRPLSWDFNQSLIILIILNIISIRAGGGGKTSLKCLKGQWLVRRMRKSRGLENGLREALAIRAHHLRRFPRTIIILSQLTLT